MAARRERISLLRTLMITVSALLLALALERFTFPSIPLTLLAGNNQFSAVYSELRGPESTLWAADPTEPLGRRRSILTVSHAFGYGVAASVSPDGARLAYGFLPEGRRDAFADGQLWVASIDGWGSRLIAGKMDLHFPPIWSPDSKRLLFKIVEAVPEENAVVPPESGRGKLDQRPHDLGFRSSLVVAILDGSARPQTIISSVGLDPFPIGWSADGRSAYYYSAEADGSQAHVVDVATSETRSLGTLSNGPVWSVKLSPDRRRLLYLTVEPAEWAMQGIAWIFDQDTQRSSMVAAPQLGPVGAIWHPAGYKITRNASQGSSQPGRSLLNASIADGSTQTFREDSAGTVAVPVSWSPDSDFLAVRRRGVAANDPLDNLAILDTTSGQMKEIKGGYAEFVGWTTLAR